MGPLIAATDRARIAMKVEYGRLPQSKTQATSNGEYFVETLDGTACDEAGILRQLGGGEVVQSRVPPRVFSEMARTSGSDQRPEPDRSGPPPPWSLPGVKPSILRIALVAKEERPSVTGPSGESPTAAFASDIRPNRRWVLP